MAQLDFEINSPSWQLLLVTNLLFQEQSKATLTGWGSFPSLKSATATDELERVFLQGEIIAEFYQQWVQLKVCRWMEKIYSAQEMCFGGTVKWWE